MNALEGEPGTAEDVSVAHTASGMLAETDVNATILPSGREVRMMVIVTVNMEK